MSEGRGESGVPAGLASWTPPDFGSPDFYLGDPESTYRLLRREAPVYRWEPRHGIAMWILSSTAAPAASG